MRLGPRPLDDGDGVGQDVLVAVDRVLFEGQGRQFREELLGQPGVHEEPEPLRGVGHHQQLVQLVADALVGDDVQAGPQAGHRFDQFLRRL